MRAFASAAVGLLFASALGGGIAAGLSGCGPTVDCESLCRRTLACEVTFTAPDDPQDRQVQSGERTELESCTSGCQASPLVTVDSARCIDELDTRDPEVCQEQVLDCLEVEDEDEL